MCRKYPNSQKSLCFDKINAKIILINLDLFGSGSDRKFVNFSDPILDPIK